MKLQRKTLLEIGIAALLLYLAIHYWDAALSVVGLLIAAAAPLIFGGALAFIVNILMSFYERNLARLKKPKIPAKLLRPLCMVLAFATLLLVIYLIIIMIVPELYRCLEVLVRAIPPALRALAQWAEETLNISGLFAQLTSEWQDDPDKLKSIITDGVNAILYGNNSEIVTEVQAGSGQLQSTITKGINVVLNGAGSVVTAVFSATTTVFSSVVTLFLGVVFAIHLLTGKERLGAQIKRVLQHCLPEKINHRVCYFTRVLRESFRSYIVCQVTEAMILGGLCALGMMILQLDYALMIGCLIGVTALIPIAGAYIGGGVGAIMLFSVEPTQALVFLIFLVILQQIEGNVIYPRVAGSSMGLPGIWVLAAITIGGGLLGITGMLIGVPLTTAVYRIIKEHVAKKEAAA